jgi:hypothetical protein
MFMNMLVAAAHAGRRGASSLSLVAVLLTSILGGAAPALADEPIVHDHRNGESPIGRIQIVVKSVEILNDHDGGPGRVRLSISLTCTATPTPCTAGQSLDWFQETYAASSGETVVVDRVLPRAEPTNSRYDSSVDGGYPVRKGHTYGVKVAMWELDTFSDNDLMGERQIVLTEANGWGTTQGTFDLQSVMGDRFGDFKVHFEIRSVDLPDLKPVAIKTTDQPGTDKQRVCMTVHNAGLRTAGAFQVALRIDGDIPNDAVATIPQLARDGYTDGCIQTRLPTSGKHTLSMLIDAPNRVLELNETNNVSEQAYTAPAKQTSASSDQPDSTTDAALPDLTVRAIKVNDQVPDGKRDCKDGKNDIAVVVKNVGDGDAESFTVRLVLDDDQDHVQEQTAGAGLDAGKESSVTFRGVRLRKGTHNLTATASASTDISESDSESNQAHNALKVTVRCSDDDEHAAG